MFLQHYSLTTSLFLLLLRQLDIVTEIITLSDYYYSLIIPSRSHKVYFINTSLLNPFLSCFSLQTFPGFLLHSIFPPSHIRLPSSGSLDLFLAIQANLILQEKAILHEDADTTICYSVLTYTTFLFSSKSAFRGTQYYANSL